MHAPCATFAVGDGDSLRLKDRQVEPAELLGVGEHLDRDDRLTKLYRDLAEGGMAKMPPSDQSGGVGFLVDRSGINWTVRIERG
jgi:uncharacterized glyoxalase superfamily protein PhnB